VQDLVAEALIRRRNDDAAMDALDVREVDTGLGPRGDLVALEVEGETGNAEPVHPELPGRLVRVGARLARRVPPGLDQGMRGGQGLSGPLARRGSHRQPQGRTRLARRHDD